MRRFSGRTTIGRILTTALLAIGGTGVVLGQAGHSVGAPILGYVPDADSVRTVIGIPAAAVVGAKPDGATGFAQIAASPSANFALVSLQATGEVKVYREGTGLVSIEGAGIAPDLLQLSPNGSAGLIWFSSLSRAQVLTNLTGTPTWRFFDATYLDPLPIAIAVSDDGQWVAGAWSQGVYAFGPKGEVVRMQIGEPGTAIAFTKNSHDFIVATSQRLISVTDPGAASAVRTLATAGDATSLNVIAVAGRGQQALAISDAGTITIVNTKDLSATTLDCACQPEGLVPMGTGSYRLSKLQDGVFKLLDLDQQSIFFVPLRSDQRNTDPPADAGAGGAQ